MLKHKVYHVTTYNVDDESNEPAPPLLEDAEQGSSYAGLNNIKVSNSSYGSYSSSGSYTEAYSASVSNYSSSEADKVDELGSSSNPYDDTGITTMRRSMTGGSTAGHVEKKNWNAEFQQLMEQQDSETKFKKLSHLARDFVRAAQSYAIIIINELCLPHNEKTIKPAELGGVAGGQKYKVQGILFKFTLDILINDSLWMYGGSKPMDEFACKAASNELKGLMGYYGCNIKGLHFPLMALIDYKGYRLIALSLLPVSPLTIRYGSCNSGLLVHRDIPELSAMMDRASTMLNLKPHIVGNTRATAQMLYSPGDVEAHQGTDGKYYVLDFSRTFPPEAIGKKAAFPRSIFYNILRPEFVRKWNTPLCSDAFSGWQKLDPNKDVHNAEVTEATMHLFEVTIPSFAQKLDSWDGEVSEKLSSAEKRSIVFRENRASLAQKLALIHLARGPNANPEREPRAKRTIRGDEKLRLLDTYHLVDEMHRSGLNLRHLGRVRFLLKSERARSFLMIEMAARAIKSIVREQMRTRMREEKILSEGPFTRTLVDIFNLVIAQCKNTESSGFWEFLRQRVATKFPFAFGTNAGLNNNINDSNTNNNNNNDTNNNSDPYNPYNAAGYGVTEAKDTPYTSGVFGELLSQETEEYADATEWCKQIDLRILFEKVEQLLGITFSQDALRDLHNNPEDFDFVDSDIGDIHPKIKHMNIVDYAEGMQLSMMALHKKERGRLLKLAASKFETSIRSQPESFQTLYQWGRALFYRAVEIFEKKKYDQLEGNKLLDQATDKFKEAIALNGEFHMPYLDLAHATMLRVSKREKPGVKEAVALYVQAGQYFAMALKLKPDDCQLVLDEARDIFAGAVQQIKNKPQLPVAHLLLGVCEICRALTTIRDSDAQIMLLWGDVLVLYFSVAPEIDDGSYIDVPVEAGQKFQLAVAFDPSLSDSVVQRAQENYKLAQQGKRNLYRCAAEIYRAVDASGLCRVNFMLEFAFCLSQLAELDKAIDQQRAYDYGLDAAEKMQHVLILNQHIMDGHIKKALSQHGGLLATLANLAINSSLLSERIRDIAKEAELRVSGDSLSSSKERAFYRSHSHPALLSLVPTLIPPKHSPSPNHEASSPASPPDKPKLRFLEFDSPTSPHSNSPIPPPPPPPPPLPSNTKRGPSAFKPVHASPKEGRLNPPILEFSRPRKSPSPPSIPLPIPEEPAVEEGTDFGIKPRGKTNAVADEPVLMFTPPPFTPISNGQSKLMSKPLASDAQTTSLADLHQTNFGVGSVSTPSYYIPPPPPLPPPRTTKKVIRRPQRYAKRGNPSPPLTHNFAPSRPAKPSQPYTPVLAPLSPQPQSRGTNPQSSSRLPLTPTDNPGFSLPRTIRKSSEALQFKVRSRLTKSGTSALMPIGLLSRPVKPTSIFGSFEVEEQETEEKINLETMVLTGCHELGPESLLSLGNLVGPHIRSIDLSLCPVTDSTFGEFSQLCPNLKHLAIRSMAIGEQIRLALSDQWKSLTSIDFEDCTFSIDQQLLEDMFRNLPDLLSLNLTNCKAITDTVLNALFCPINLPLAPLPPPPKVPLKSLFLKNCTRVTYAAIVDIVKYGNLQQLDLSGCSKLTDEDLIPLAACEEMTTLLLESCYKVTDKFILRAAKNMTNLQRLSLKMCKNITDEAIVFISTTLQQLQSINLARCFRVSDLGIVTLASQLSGTLTSMDLTLCTKLTNASAVAIAEHCSNLTKLDISECSSISDDGLAPLLRNITSLVNLHVNMCGEVTSRSLLELAVNTRTTPLPLQVLKIGACQLPDNLMEKLSHTIGLLRDLSVERSYVLTNIGVIAIARNLPHLTGLNIMECMRVDNAGVLAVARGLRRLRHLNISGLRIDGDPIKELGRQAPPLHSLAMARCPEIDDAAMAVLAQNVPTLTRLDISGDNKITDKSIVVLAQYAPNLVTLEMKECQKISKVSFDALRRGCPHFKSSTISIHHKSIVDELKTTNSPSSSPVPPTDLVDELRTRTGLGGAGLRRVRRSSEVSDSRGTATPSPVSGMNPMSPPDTIAAAWEKAVAGGLEGGMIVNVGKKGSEKQRGAIIVESVVIPPPPVYLPFSTKIEYEILKVPANRPQDLDPAALEKYISDEQFPLVFKISCAEFERLPEWKQQRMKKQLILF